MPANPRELFRLMNHVPEVLSDFPDRWVPKDGNAERVLKSRTLTTLYNTRGRPVGAWLDNLHRELDNAVAAAYGWPADISNDDALERILALNAERVGQCS